MSAKETEHRWNADVGNNATVPLVFTVKLDGALHLWRIEGEDPDDVDPFDPSTTELARIAKAYRAGYNTALGKFPR